MTKPCLRQYEDAIETLSPKQLFLHSYRSFAYWYHTQKELLQAIIKESKFNLANHLNDNFLTSNIQLASESQYGKSELNKILNSQSFATLHYHVHQMNKTHLIASSDVVIPYYYLNNKPIYSSTQREEHAKVILTVLPGQITSIIIMACLPDDIKAIKFIDDFKKLSAQEFEENISSLLIYSHGNTFFSPKIWDQIDELDKSFLLSDLNNLYFEESNGDTVFDRYFHSNVNLFSYPLPNNHNVD